VPVFGAAQVRAATRRHLSHRCRAPRSIKPKKGIRLHRPLNLDALDTTVVDGIPITTVAQTLLDVAAPRFRLNVAKLLHEAAVQKLLDVRAIWSVLARNPRAPGARHLEEALREEVPFTRSELEEAARRVYRSCSVPEPEWTSRSTGRPRGWHTPSSPPCLGPETPNTSQYRGPRPVSA
jgi:hypothetical protein